MKIVVLSPEDPQDIRTWSGTPYHLVREFRRRQLLSNAIMVNPGRAATTILKLASLDLAESLKRRRPVSRLKTSRLYHKILELRLRALSNMLDDDQVVIEIGDLGAVGETPFFIYMDLDYDTLIAYYRETGHPAPGFKTLTLADLERLRERQYSIFERAAGVFTMSQFLKDSVLGSGVFRPHQVHAVGAGANLLDLECPPHPTEAYESKTILFVGKDFERKGGPLLLEAFRMVRSDHKDARLVIAGPERHGSGDGITWYGPVDKNLLASLYAKASVFCMPSTFEAFGIVFIEAMAHGVPVIGTNRMAMKEFIRPGLNGFLLEKDDPALLAEILSEALSNPERLKRMGDAARNVAAEYTWPKVVDRMLAGIGQALGSACSR